jgi:hypothetical protein
MIAVKASSFGRVGTLATVFGSMPKRRAASRWLIPSTWQA